MDERAAPEAEPHTGAVATAEPAGPTILQRLRASPITFGLTAINLAVMVLVQLHGNIEAPGTLLMFGADEPLHVWSGEYWRLATNMFLHIGWIHFAWNTYASVGWCTTIEEVLGKKRFLLVYLLSGLGASCMSMAATLFFGPKYSAGASGAMFGIVGATLALQRRQLPSFAAFFAHKAIRSTLIQIGIWTAIGLTALRMDNAAHLGGLLVGFAVTWLLTSPAPRMGWLAFAAAFATLFTVAVRPWWTPSGPEANDLVAYAKAYFSGQVIVGRDGKPEPWPKNPARGERLLDKGCKHGLPSACRALADHIAAMGAPDAREKSDELRRRTCDLDPAYCRQVE